MVWRGTFGRLCRWKRRGTELDSTVIQASPLPCSTRSSCCPRHRAHHRDAGRPHPARRAHPRPDVLHAACPGLRRLPFADRGALPVQRVRAPRRLGLRRSRAQRGAGDPQGLAQAQIGRERSLTPRKETTGDSGSGMFTRLPEASTSPGTCPPGERAKVLGLVRCRRVEYADMAGFRDQTREDAR